LTVGLFVVISSLDNAAVAAPVPLYPQISMHLGVAESSIGLITGLVILVIGASAFLAGYVGDRGPRKATLIASTGIWSAGMLLTTTVDSYVGYLGFQLLAAVGFGGVISVGLSTISDFVSPQHRGFALSVWGLSQGLGVGLGVLLGGLTGASDWTIPFVVIGAVGALGAVAYLVAFSPEVGRREEELEELRSSGRAYEHRIEKADVLPLLRKRSNVWLVLIALTSQMAYGSLIWLPRLFTTKAEVGGLTLEQATVVGSSFAVFFQAGGIVSVLAGHLGDRWQLRDERGRAFLSAIGIAGAVPFFMLLFLMPFPTFTLAPDAGNIEVISAIGASVLSEPLILSAFIVAFLAISLSSFDTPNWFALVAEVNLPEHRGTVFGYAHLAIAIGRGVAAGLTGFAIGVFAGVFDPPLHIALALSAMMLFFIPAAAGYLRLASRTREDRAEIRATLLHRAQGDPPDGCGC